MSRGRVALTLLVGLAILTAWWAWVVMLCVGALAGLEVVGATVSFVESLPLGAGFVLLGILPLAGLLLAAVGDPPTREEPDPSRGPAPGGGYRPRHHSGR